MDEPGDMDELRDSDAIAFAAEDAAPAPGGTMRGSWKVLVVDDDMEVHSVTRLVLAGYRFAGRGMTLINAFSAREAKKLFASNPDIALVLLDVVMEHDQAGLECVRYIRESLKNTDVRIVLRTGQPGQAPEERVIVDYDINDYKEKTELTSTRLLATVTAALRTYGQLRTMRRYREGLELIVRSAARLYDVQTMRSFLTGLLAQITALIDCVGGPAAECTAGFAAVGSTSAWEVLATAGRFQGAIPPTVDDLLDADVSHLVADPRLLPASHFGEACFVSLHRSHDERTVVVYLADCPQLDAAARELIQEFTATIPAALANVQMAEDLRAQRSQGAGPKADEATG
ncbi:MAG: DUF3369 domain-containing protein [Planctomycetota bacterium]